MLYYLIGGYLALINLVLFVLMGRDKAAARTGARRTPEATLFTLAVLGGSLGGTLAMVFFRHKTRKIAFRIGFPLILIIHFLLAAKFLNIQ